MSDPHGDARTPALDLTGSSAEVRELPPAPPLVFYKSVQWRCPTCGYQGYECISVTLPEHAGSYCLNCWAQWIQANIPRLVVVDDPAAEKP